jgi:hypothetical protein
VLWSRHEPVSVLGTARNAYGQQEIDDLFTVLAKSFSGCTSYACIGLKHPHGHQHSYGSCRS